MRTVISILAGLVAILAGYLIVVYLWPSGKGSIVVISDPPGAHVWVDLEPTNTVTDGKVSGIPRGRHSITIKLDTLMAEPFAHVVDVRGGKPDTVRFTLLTPRGEMVARTVGQRLSAAPAASPINTTPDVVEIPTAADLRNAAAAQDAAAADPAGTPAEPLPQLKAAVPTDQMPEVALVPLPPRDQPIEAIAPPRAEKEAGVIEVSGTRKGAIIYVNDRKLPERIPASITLPFGTYTVRAELEGYTATPDEHAVRVRRTAASQSVHFTFEEAAPEARIIAVSTGPVEGRIFVDGVLTGEGKAEVERDYGTYVVTFGDVSGWKKPAPTRVTLTPAKPSHNVEAKYVRLFSIHAQVNGAGAIDLEGMADWAGGVIFEAGKPQVSTSHGPKLTEIPDAEGKYGWELGMGDPNRNPTGGDYVAFTFKLPNDVPPDTPLNLRLYLYKSNRRYPFSLTSRSEVVVEVNGRKFLNGFAPRYTTNSADLERYEEWSLQKTLKAGDNRVLIYTGPGNTVFNYLWKVEIQ